MRIVLITVALLLSACDSPQPPVAEEQDSVATADLVLRGGKVYTMDAARSWAEAIAISGGNIVFVGRDSDVAPYIGAATRVVELDGHMVMPSFQDSHIHPLSAGMEAIAIDLNDSESLEEYIDKIAAYAAANPDKQWLLGGGWSMAVFGPGAMASRRLIDEVVPDRPVYLTSRDGHTGWANSKALELAGIDRDTADPASGRVDRDPATGDPIGSLQEGAMGLVTRHIPPADLETRTAGLQYAINLLNNYGITAIQDASVDRESLETYRALEQRGELSLRVVGSIWWERDEGLEQIAQIDELRDEFSAGRLRATTVKIMQDGVMENFTAAVLEPYIGQGGVRGIPMIEPESLNAAVTALDAAGYQVHFHAIGDAAIRQCLDAVQAARSSNGNNGLRHHISHLQLIDPTDIPRFRQLGVIANFQPLWAYADEYITDLTLPYMSAARARWLYPIASVQKSGATIAFGSDWSVSTANPFHQIETAITRMGATGDTQTPFIPIEAIDLPTALAAFTINAAFVNNLDAVSGSLEAGKAADLVVLDRNLFDIPAEEISETNVLMTLLDGEAVHGNPTLL
ncbi:MAG: amidohydrolase [Gammaproteobacteria bacterium]|nr:amidohydrolase [Gammaproteobacteria bacterium]